MWNRDPRLQDLLELFLRMAKKTGRPYAIGGALALEAHGYKRETSDVDVFLQHEDRLAWLRAAREVGFKLIPVFGEIHTVAVLPEHNDPDVRLDLLFPAADPELAAVEAPTRAKIGDFEVSVFPVELLAAAKFLSDRPEDNRDFVVMLKHGMFEVETVRAVVAIVDSEALPNFDFIIEELSKPKKPPRPRGRLPRKSK